MDSVSGMYTVDSIDVTSGVVGISDIITNDSVGGDIVNIADILPVSPVVMPEEIFGSSSVLADGLPLFDLYDPFERFLTGNPVFSILVLLGFCAYCLLVYNYRAQAITLLNMFRGSLYIEKILREQNFTFEILLRSMIILGMALSGVTIVKFADSYAGDYISQLLPYWGILLLPLLMWVVISIIWFYQVFCLKAVGWLTMSSGFTGDIKYLRKLTAGLSFLFLNPVMMLYSMSAGRASSIMFSILCIGASLLFIFLLFRTYMLFIQQKISILYWFLYLCTVEIFPISFFVLFALKNV